MLRVEEKPLMLLIEDDLDTMMHEHWQECAPDKDNVPLDPDWSLGLKMEKDGSFEIATPILSKLALHAYNVGIYVKPEHRRGNTGAKLVVESEKLLKKAGVKYIGYLSPISSTVLNLILEKDGYTKDHVNYLKMVA